MLEVGFFVERTYLWSSGCDVCMFAAPTALSYEHVGTQRLSDVPGLCVVVIVCVFQLFTS